MLQWYWCYNLAKFVLPVSEVVAGCMCVRVSYNHGEVYIELRVNFRVVLVGEWRQAKVIEFFLALKL